MGKGQGKASETAEGLAATKTQSSDADGTTSPPPGEEAVRLDPKLRYLDPSKPEEKLTGIEVASLINQGRIFREAQSARDKAMAELQQKQAEIKTLQDRAEAAERARQELETKKLFVDKWEEISKATKPEKEAETDWWSAAETPQEQATPLKAEDALRRLDELANEKLQVLERSAEDAVERVLAKKQAEEESQKRVNQFVTRARRVKSEMLEAELPDVPVSERETILNLQDQATELDSIARELAAAGNDDKAEEAWVQAQARNAELLRRNTDARAEQRKLSEEKQRREEIESLSKGTSSVVKTKPRTRKWRVGKDVEADEQARYEQAIEIERRVKELKNY